MACESKRFFPLWHIFIITVQRNFRRVFNISIVEGEGMFLHVIQSWISIINFKILVIFEQITKAVKKCKNSRKHFTVTTSNRSKSTTLGNGQCSFLNSSDRITRRRLYNDLQIFSYTCSADCTATFSKWFLQENWML